MKRDQIQITKAQIEPFSSPKLVDASAFLTFREKVYDHIRLDEIITHLLRHNQCGKERKIRKSNNFMEVICG